MARMFSSTMIISDLKSINPLSSFFYNRWDVKIDSNVIGEQKDESVGQTATIGRYKQQTIRTADYVFSSKSDDVAVVGLSRFFV